MSKVKLTAGRIEKFQCEPGKEQSFLWCAEVPGLGLRATNRTNEKRYIFQAKVNKKTMRKTIGDTTAWSISDAQAEARRLQVLIDKGYDPRRIESDEKVAREKRDTDEVKKRKLESATFGDAWLEYVAERQPFWSELHFRDHCKMVDVGGKPRSRNNKLLTVPGMFAPFAVMKLVEITSDVVEEWSKRESTIRPTRARLALRLLKAFLNWCSEHPVYKFIVKDNVAKNKKAREHLGKQKAKNDVLQKEQLKDWFTVVKQINNPIISAYLQILLLTGARRNELIQLRWENIDFRWNSITIHDKVDDFRIIPLTPYVSYLLSRLPRVNSYVFYSPTSASGCLADPSIAHRKACAIAGLNLSLHGLRRSFASLTEWVEMPAGIAAQIQGHAPQGVREQNYIRRPLDLLRVWHNKIEAWLLEQASIKFITEKTSLHVVKSA